MWKDPDFDPKQKAFYYGRVIEIPTPRWTAYDMKRFGVKPLDGTAVDGDRAGLYIAHLVHAVGLSGILTEAAVYHGDCADMVRNSFDHDDRIGP